MCWVSSFTCRKVEVTNVSLIDYHWGRREMTTMKNPAHPGLTVKHDCLADLGLSIAQGAKVLGVTRQALNNIVSGKSGISPEMAVRLAKAFGSSPETWLGMQADYDLAQLRSGSGEIRVERVPRPQHDRQTLG
jgi:antitoxin HigA-1